MRSIRSLALLTGSLFCAMTTVADPVTSFVRVEGRRFTAGGEPYAVCGTNLWYGAHLGRPSNPAGRARLLRELDRLQALGVNNLRVLGAAEAIDVPLTLRPAIQTAPGEYNEDVLQGLDFLTAEAGRRGMRLVVFLNNYWDWSGGMSQYLAWVNGAPAVALGRTPWQEFNAALSRFYTDEAANALYRRYIAMLVARRNTVTGRLYRDDPAIMTWQLANEPRPGAREGEEAAVFAAFLRWVDTTSAYIHSLDANHLVTTGSEGYQGCGDSDERFRAVHAVAGIDYAVFHLWPKNWRWFEASQAAATIEAALTKSRDYVLRHFAEAATIDKPVVCEEFGLDRDSGLGLDVPTTCRDRLYAEVFGLIESSRSAGGPAAGSNFWLWGGEGRPPQLADAPDGIGAGDMQQEEAGRNTVFDADATTLAIIRGHFEALKNQTLDTLPVRGGAAKTAYLTIDDGPTAATGRKLDFLVARKIPAVLFCTGSALERERAAAVDALKRGFVLGNHSYDHPHFSALPIEECLAQIRRTDAIIESIHAEAGVPRRAKYFRFPYGDKGSRTGGNAFAKPSADGAAHKAAIQGFLRELGYTLPELPGVTYPRWRTVLAADVDWYWTYDVKEWALDVQPPEPDVRTVEDLGLRMDRLAPGDGFGLNTAGSDEVILIHDHAHTDALFEPLVARLQAKGLKFALPE
jgi:mannan endo-1,4-beta-mannosidase